MHRFFLLKRPMTLGVRAVAFDADGRVFLVRHTYVSGWHLPGGGVERGETAGDSLRKELKEEGNLSLAADPELFAVYFNPSVSPWDHVLLYRCPRVIQSEPKRGDSEIAEARFFPIEALPVGTTRATRQRLAELDGSAVSQIW